MNAQAPAPAHLGRLADKVRTVSDSQAAKLVSAAETAVDSLKDEVLDTLAKEIGRMEILVEAATNKPRDNAAELSWLYEILFDAKALAGTFNYPLISEIGESLRRFLKGIQIAGPSRLAIVEHHVHAMSAAIRDGHTGHDDPIGHAILESLEEAKKIVRGAAALNSPIMRLVAEN